MHETAASILLNDADELAASPQMASLASSEMRSAESQHEQSMARTSVANEELSGQSTANDYGKATSIIQRPPRALRLLRRLSPPSPTRFKPAPIPCRSSSTQMTDRATPRAAQSQCGWRNRLRRNASFSSRSQASSRRPHLQQLRNSGSAPISPRRQRQTISRLRQRVSAAATAQDTFSALDSGTSPGTPAWTHAGSQHAEAGFRDPALGWVGVRADLNADGIHATLVPSSAEAAQALNGHLAGLSTHLVEQQSPVASLTMASPSESGIENGMGQRMQQGAEGNPQGNAPDEAPAGHRKMHRRLASTSVPDAPAQAGIRDSFTHTGELRGTHISVMA